MPGSNIIRSFPLEPCNHIYFLFLTEDPRTGDGVTCGIGSFGFGPDGSLYRKTGVGNTDWTIALDVPGNGGSAAQPVSVLKATVELTDAQIKALPAGLTALVAAPGPGIIRHFRGAMIVVKIAAAPYSGISVSSKLYVEYAGQGQPLGAALNVDGVNLLLGTVYPDETRTYVATIEPQNFAVVNGTDVIPSANVASSDNFENLGFRLRMENGSSDPLGGGDPANSAVVTLIYTDVAIPA